jgi:polysaccharide pyruvyl transferase WcaK-like protein
MTSVRDQDFRATPTQEDSSTKTGAAAELRASVKERRRSFDFFGHFGHGNFGNEITLQATLFDLRRRMPNVELRCICTGPDVTATTHKIAALPVSPTAIEAWKPSNRLVRALRSVFLGIPNELYRFLDAFATLRRTDVFIVPGTGLLTDAYGLRGWGPYSLFKWSLAAKLCGCKLVFISVGAGPVLSRAGEWLIKSALALADFRSYRDSETKEYLLSIGAASNSDRVYPDLAFGIAGELAPKSASPKRRPVVGLGLMLYHEKLSSGKSGESTYAAYLEQLAILVEWLLARNYDVRLLIGELSDRTVVAEFKALLKTRLEVYDAERILDDPVCSVEELLAQIASTDAVIVTRFHNVLFALALNKPVISISFHPKCTSLMKSMGLQEYCQDIHELKADRLIEQFCQLEKNASDLKQKIGEQVAECRKALDEQYQLIMQGFLLG